MNVKKLINLLQNEVKKEDRENAQIEIWEDEQEYKIESMRGFSISPDIVIMIKKTVSPILKPATFKNKHQKKVKAIVKDIRKQNNGG